MFSLHYAIIRSCSRIIVLDFCLERDLSKFPCLLQHPHNQVWRIQSVGRALRWRRGDVTAAVRIGWSLEEAISKEGNKSLPLFLITEVREKEKKC